MQPPGRRIRSLEAGYLASSGAARGGRGLKPPPQFGQTPPSTESAQAAQKVHSNEQIIASVDSGGKSLSQHSQFGRICSMEASA
jgi:hypothetical protein